MRFKKIILTFICGLCVSGACIDTSTAQEICPLDNMKPKTVSSLKAFAALPVLNQGRIKPLDSYAQGFLLQLSGRRSYQKESAIEWFARFLLAPRTTFDDQVFLVNNPEILEAIGVEAQKRRRYSYRQLDSGYEKIQELALALKDVEPKDQSVLEKEVLRVYNNIQVFSRISGAFMYAVVHPDFAIGSEEVRKLLTLPDGYLQFSFFDIMDKSKILFKETAVLERKPKAQWTDIDKELTRLIDALFFWQQHYAQCPFGIIPTKSVENEEWLSPMDTMIGGFFDPVYFEEIKSLRNMTVYYWNGKQSEFDQEANHFKKHVYDRLSDSEKKAVDRIPFELAYNKFNFFLWAKLVYGLAFLLFLFSLMMPLKSFYKLAIGLISFGVFMHISAIGLRMLILSRAPVSNLYDTFIFVGLIGVLLGLFMEKINKNWLGIVVAAISGFVMLFIAGKFSAEGDTMQMLVAVLDSNFWLSTHVISITIGYAGCCVAGVVGHIYVLQALANAENTKRLETTYKNMMGILGFGLTMTFLGTALGGIWADQSWGRFWGWDPKENGALLIVLWSAIIFHARIARMINPLGAAVGCILGLIVVMWAWFGVNLLSVGLHSYGFTSGLAVRLSVYVVIELLFIAVTVYLLGKKNMKI